MRKSIFLCISKLNYFTNIVAAGLILVFLSSDHVQAQGREGLRFEISFPPTASFESITGRVFLAFAPDDEREPRLQVGRYGVPFFGVDVEGLKPGESAIIDETTLGYPPEHLSSLPEGTYFIQAVISKYTRFERSDGHVVWMHMDQWEGQNWRRSPGNLVSDVIQVSIGPESTGVTQISADHVIPPIELIPDTRWVKRIKIQSQKLTAFWGHPIYIGATVLLPKDYDSHPDVQYPTVYQQGHFSSRPPLRFQEGNSFYEAWVSTDFPRFIAVTIQHPSPYFDDSYAVNSVNNGPYGDAIHEELIPELERQFRMIPESWARVLTGGSTGGWESFALQVFYPDFYGGTWSYAPDPLDFRNVEGIDIYDDKNAFYKEYDWHKTPTTNTRDNVTGAVRLTSAQRNRMELVNGTKGRSGQQLDVWSSVFGPVGEDGYFKPLFDKATGVIDPGVAGYWKENYDMRYILQRDWKTLGPKLVGKLNIIVGHMDNFLLNFGVYYLEEFLESTTDPYYAGSISYGKRGGHGYRPYGSDELLRVMAAHISRMAPDGSDISSWKY
jgi:Putative esterase